MTYNLSSLAMNADLYAGAQNTKHDAMRCSHAISRVSAMFMFNVSETWTSLSHGSSREDTPLHTVAKKPSNSTLRRKSVPTIQYVWNDGQNNTLRGTVICTIHHVLLRQYQNQRGLGLRATIRMQEMKNPYPPSLLDCSGSERRLFGISNRTPLSWLGFYADYLSPSRIFHEIISY